jgi:hypothetical protein
MIQSDCCSEFRVGSWAEHNIIICIPALVCTLEVIELPTIGIWTLLLEDFIIPVKVRRWLGPVLYIAAATNTCSFVMRRAAEV